VKVGQSLHLDALRDANVVQAAMHLVFLFLSRQEEDRALFDLHSKPVFASGS
jgi:hypothetical protein